jgi:hypothetical protein
MFSHGHALSASPKPADLGLLAQAGDQPISATITLKLRDLAGAEAMMRRVATPGADQVQAQFGPSQGTVDSVTARTFVSRA